MIVNIAAESLVALCSWKTKHVDNELRYLAEEISKENVEGTTWFLLAACGEM